jgi:subtilisin family serine protease
MSDQAAIAQQARSQGVRVLHQYSQFPLLALEVNENAVQGLARSPRVISVTEDIPEPPSLDSSLPVIGADVVRAAGFTGTGITVGILDTGIDNAHPFVASRVVSEACYSTPNTNPANQETTLCPSGTTGAGTASINIAACQSGAQNICDHGMHVAGIAAGGTGQPSPAPAAGVAPGANILAIRVFTRFNRAVDCSPSPAPCVLSYRSDQIAGLNRVFALRNTFNIAAANMSLGGGQFNAACDTDARKVPIDALLGQGIATVIAAGNNGFAASVGRPGCISTAVTIGATDDSDNIANFSNRGTLLDLFAPGVAISSSIANNNYGPKQGTSMSAPHVTGAWAIMRQVFPTATVAQILTRLQNTGVPITDANNVVRSRINLAAASATGTIVIQKNTTPAGRTGFSFTDNIAPPNSFSLDDGQSQTFNNVLPGAYSVTENAPGSFMALSALSCDDDDSTGDVSARTASINVATGETVTCTFTNSDLPPSVSATPSTQTVQYSDHIQDITVTAMDSDQDALSASFSYDVDGGGFNPGLPTGLSSTDNGCSTAGDEQTCTWTIGGTAGVAAGTYTIRSTVTDDDGDAADKDVTVNVNPEDASVSFDAGNPVAVSVASPGGNSGPFSMTVHVEETEPDLATVAPAAGSIANAVVSMSLVPIGTGGSQAGTCVQVGVTGAGYGEVLEVRCDFNNVPVNTYAATVTVDGGYYTGGGEDVLTVFDKSLGFTTGGGWFHWPGTTDRTNFGYTMKYNKRGQNVKGSLLMIRHLADGTKYRVKSNALRGLAIGDGGGFGWASFSGKSTYLEPGWPDPVGNHRFVAYVEDHGEPGINDRFWIEVHDRNGNVIAASSMDRPGDANAETLEGGNIVVPHN